ncbi:SH3 domain-containing protein [Paracoccus suum]|uniref:SH3 domain-containing protein n=1 Tax=Paracoccus suum TaxID=2259340 RepID=UPI0013B06808|nr:SH3 domain-containing protein [Paracoccus suum]
MAPQSIETAQQVPEDAGTPPAVLMTAALSAPPTAMSRGAPALQPSPEHAATTALKTVAAQTSSVYVTSDAVNLRAGPDQAAAILAKLKRGQALAPVGPPVGGWVEVRNGSQNGFVSARYLSNLPPA